MQSDTTARQRTILKWEIMGRGGSRGLQETMKSLRFIHRSASSPEIQDEKNWMYWKRFMEGVMKARETCWWN